MKRKALTFALALIAALSVDSMGQLLTGGDVRFVSPAEAIVGRPLTPVSYAGVARRTVRRCAAYC